METNRISTITAIVANTTAMPSYVKTRIISVKGVRTEMLHCCF